MKKSSKEPRLPEPRKTWAPKTLDVRLEFIHPTAKLVQIAGTFNDWQPATTAMIPLAKGRWAKNLTLPPGIYEYRLVVDGEWMTDPLARETVANPFGSDNSILRVIPPQ